MSRASPANRADSILSRGGSSSVFLGGVPGELSGEDERPLGGSGAFLPENFENWNPRNTISCNLSIEL